MKKVFGFVIAILVLGLFFSCGEKEPPAQPEPVAEQPAPEPEPEAPAAVGVEDAETEELAPVEPPKYNEGMITFFSGDVFILDAGEWWEVAIGDMLMEQDILKTEAASYCEIQFGDAAVVRVQENTEVAMQNIALAPGEADIDVGLKGGSVLAKVKKLGGDESFSVNTQTAVCGVRGTEFAVTSDPEKGTNLAVKEGSVAVLPSSVDIDKLKKQVGEENADLNQILDDLEKSAPLVEANQEIEIDEETIKGTEEAAKIVEAAVEEIVRTAVVEEPADDGTVQAPVIKEVDQQKLADLRKAVEKTKEEVAAKVAPPKEITEENTEKLQEIDKMKIIEITVQDEEGEAPEPAITLHKISLSIEPREAAISLGGEKMGTGKFSGIYPEGEQLEFTITMEGYEQKDLSIRSSAETAKAYKITLKELPKVEPPEVSIETEPNDAAIFLDGKEVGTGIYTDTHEPGETLTFTVSKAGFKDKEIEISVEEEDIQETVKLEAVKEDIQVAVEPKDASIYLDGELVGKGTYKEKHEVGKKLVFALRKDDYQEEMLEFTVEEGKPVNRTVALKEILYTEAVNVSVEPRDTSIYVNGRLVGTGTYNKEHGVGETLAFSFRKEGYDEQELKVNIQRGNPVTRTVRLVKSIVMEQVRVNVVPADALIYLDGDYVGRGSYTEEHEAGSRLRFSFKKEGYVEDDVTLTVQEGRAVNRTVRLEEAIVTVAVQVAVQPADAAVRLNGVSQGTGTYRRNHDEGERLSFSIQRRGYEPQEVTITVGKTDINRTVTLKPKTIQYDASVSTGKLVGSVVYAGGTVFAADSSGAVSAIDMEGNKLWSFTSTNAPNENSYPVLIGGVVYFSGSKELVVANAASGGIASRVPLDASAAHLFGRRVVPSNSGILLPTNESIRIIAAGSGAVTGQIALPKGSRMTPAVWNNKIIIADQQGSLLIVNPNSKNPVEAEITTAAVQPVALAPTIIGNKAVFSGRKGTVVCVDLASQQVLWEKTLPGNASVFTDISTNGTGVYAYAKGTIYSMNINNGADMLAPIGGVTAPPLCSGSNIIYGTGGQLVVQNGFNGGIVSRVTIPGGVTTKPADVGGKVVVGTGNGHLLIVNP